MVVWTVDFCLGEYPISPFNQELVSGTSFLLKGLSRACRYLASTQAMYGSLRHQWSTPIEIIVDTPPCNLHIDRLVTISRDSCSQSSSFYIPSHTISTIEARVSTTAPVLASQLVWEDTDRNVTVLTVDGYFVTYTENQFNQLNWKMLEFNIKSSVTISPLRRNATYQVNIYRVTKKVAARASVVRFKTET
uniref:Fibronectin type-III domain-containing protein n=1 Tax=Ciona savignyi TaxID=51511 RepID=H2Z047_CIOSA